jgi:hypothetical protein
MDDKNAYSSPIAAEAVGERPRTPPTDTGEHAVRPVATSAGPGARIADRTAESVGERTGAAYADGTTDEARKRSGKVVRSAGMQGGRWQASSTKTFVTVVAAFALSYVAALLIHHRPQPSRSQA